MCSRACHLLLVGWKVTVAFVSQLQPQEISPPPTANLDRSNDKVYENVTGLVKAVIEMSSKIQPASPEEYVPMVKVRPSGLDLQAHFRSVHCAENKGPCWRSARSPVCHTAFATTPLRLPLSRPCLEWEFRHMLGPSLRWGVGSHQHLALMTTGVTGSSLVLSRCSWARGLRVALSLVHLQGMSKWTLCSGFYFCAVEND